MNRKRSQFDEFDVDKDVDKYGRPKFKCRILMTGCELWSAEVDLKVAIDASNWNEVAILCRTNRFEHLIDHVLWHKHVASIMLEHAVFSNDWNEVIRLAKLGCNLNQFLNLNPVLHYAVSKAPLSVINDLLALGADPKYMSMKTGSTALHVAAVRGVKRGSHSPSIEDQLETLQIIQLLRNHGATPLPMGFFGSPENRPTPDALAKNAGLLVIMHALR